ncbi:envelope stress sensor histidine kinase CpxA [Pasteurella testudinis]|uniref:envelope stress sensor histidine kinase CpxA n=1 Tax=Pasteurella testudinis TaxID=761 RepID=UPI004059EBE2
MKILRKFFRLLNSINVQIFFLFWLIWLAFFVLMGFAFFIPTMDARNYTELSNDEVNLYQFEVIKLTKNNILYDLQYQNNTSHNLQDDRPNMMQPSRKPVLLDPNDFNKIIGQLDYNESSQLYQFANRSNNPLSPQKRRFYNQDIIGPFISPYPLSEESEPYLLYFIDVVDPQREFINFFFDHPLIMLFLLMATSTPLLLGLIFSLTQPIKELRSAANAISTGNLSVNPILEERGSMELREVGKSFNHMVMSLEHMISSQQRLLLDVSHELRTPLTRLQLAAALLRRRQGENAELQRIETETERMEKMLNQLLTLSRQSANAHINRAIFPLPRIWEEVVEDAKFESRERHFEFSFSQHIQNPQNYFINGNEDTLASALENIIRNAFKYAKGQVHLNCRIINDKQLEIVVDDNGDGVDEHEYQQIFLPFYRTDQARARTTGGSGLGLSIVANSVEQHKGTVTASKSPLGGLRITIHLPLWLEA